MVVCEKLKRDRIKNVDLRKTVQIDSLEEKRRERRLRWFRHVMKMDNVGLPKKMYNIVVLYD